MSDIIFKFDDERAEEILSVVYACYLNGSHLYRYYHAKNGSAPQHKHIPTSIKKRSAEHQIFLFFASILTYHSQSEMGFQQCLKLYDEWPEFFRPDVCRKSPHKLQIAFKKVGFIYPNEAARRWFFSAKGLFEEYDSNPLMIFKNGSIDDALKRKVRGNKNLLPGFGPKLLSLLALFYEELNLLNALPDAFPCDIHVQAQCIGLDIAKSQEKIFRTDPFAEFLRKNISGVCRNKNISALDLSHALWFLGNRLCMYCKKKKTTSEKFCPIFKYCSGRISTISYRRKGLWDTNKPSMDPLPLFDTAKAG